MNARSSLTYARTWLVGEGRWRETVLAAVARLEEMAERDGIFFSPCQDYGALTATKRRSALNPRYLMPTGRLTKRNAVWISGVAPDKVMVASRQAIRLYNWYDGANLASESRALRVYYDHPEDAPHTDHCIISAPIADRIHGRVCFNGAVWVAPDLRGPRPELGGVFVSQIVSALSRMFALYLFDPDWCVATTPADHFKRGTSERYGWAGIAHPAHVERVGDSINDVHLMWSRREDMLAEAERIARDGLQPAEAA